MVWNIELQKWWIINSSLLLHAMFSNQNTFLHLLHLPPILLHLLLSSFPSSSDNYSSNSLPSSSSSTALPPPHCAYNKFIPFLFLKQVNIVSISNIHRTVQTFTSCFILQISQAKIFSHLANYHTMCGWRRQLSQLVN